MNQVNDCFLECISLKIDISFNKVSPDVIGLVFKRFSTSVQQSLEKLRKEFISSKLQVFFVQGRNRIGLSLLNNEEKISIHSGMMDYEKNLFEKFFATSKTEDKIILTFYTSMKDDKLRLFPDRNNQPFFLPVYIYKPTPVFDFICDENSDCNKGIFTSNQAGPEFPYRLN
jgi:hypothetical protein